LNPGRILESPILVSHALDIVVIFKSSLGVAVAMSVISVLRR